MRACGDCSECCRLLPTAFVAGEDEEGSETYFTPTGDWCKYCDQPGCSIYATLKQKPCMEFKCGWQLNSSIPDELKPNRSGVVLEVLDNNVNTTRFWIDEKNFSNTDTAVTELEKYTTRKFTRKYTGKNHDY